ncbi:MAG TPA: APC family permease [Anaerolineae bacterium]|nr:APC family permease [Anaerolineae bacterium]
MAAETGGMKKTLGLTGVTVNAMALIAPGAFLWLTFQLQAANTDASGASTAMDMWTGIVAALIVAFLTAISFSELARRYPDAGSGSAYYFAEKAFLDRKEPSHRRWARIAKFITGWAAHLFYWVYPGVMVAFMATLLTYIASQFGITIPPIGQVAIALVFAAIVGFVAVRGISGSTTASIVINVIQIVTLVIFSILAILFRVQNPAGVTPTGWFQPNAASIVIPHSLTAILFQSTIAILILVGFESATALGAEAKNPKRDIPRGVLLSLVIQGLFCYLLEYFAANYALSNTLTATAADGSTVTGIAAAATSSAPIGDMAIQLGNAFLGGNGFAFMLILAASVAIAVLGTTLAAMNTGVRISFAMAQDREMPDIMGLLHGKYATPHFGVLVMVIVSGIIGAVGVVGGVTTLTGITLASNLGTFVLYALICGLTIVAFTGTHGFNRFKHIIIPILGVVTNVGLVLAIFGMGIVTGGSTATATYLAIVISVVWLIVSGTYFIITSKRSGRAIVPSAAAMVTEKS